MILENICNDNTDDKEQILILESNFDSIKEDVKIANLSNYKKKRFDRKCLNYIDEMKDVYLKLSKFGVNEKEIINTFKIWLIKKNRFYQRSIDKIVSCSGAKIGYCKEEINFDMTPEHKAKYLELLTEKLKDYYNTIRDNNFKNELYKGERKPFFKIKKAKDFARDAFNYSFELVENSYNQKLEEHNKKQDLKRSKEKVMRRTSKGYIPGVKPKIEEVLLTEEELKELPDYSSERTINEFEIKKTQIDDY